MKSTVRIPADKYVDQELLPDTEKHRRKLERMGKQQKTEYMLKRSQQRSELLDFENTQRRIRALKSHCVLFKLRLFAIPDYDVAHFHMREAFSACANDEEHGILLYYFHEYLSLFCVSFANLLIYICVMFWCE